VGRGGNVGANQEGKDRVKTTRFTTGALWENRHKARSNGQLKKREKRKCGLCNGPPGQEKERNEKHITREKTLAEKESLCSGTVGNGAVKGLKNSKSGVQYPVQEKEKKGNSQKQSQENALGGRPRGKAVRITASSQKKKKKRERKKETCRLQNRTSKKTHQVNTTRGGRRICERIVAKATQLPWLEKKEDSDQNETRWLLNDSMHWECGEQGSGS